MQLELLNKLQIEEIYNQHMVNDFPEDELKPLSIIKDAVEAGFYTCFGLNNGEFIVGYIFLERKPMTEDYLVDYLAIFDEYRNQGYGSLMLEELRKTLSSATSIIVEVENPDFAENGEDRLIQQRRYNFYIRNGFRDTGARVTCFGVPFALIETGVGLVHSEEEIITLYHDLYRAILPPDLYQNNIF